MHKKFKIGLGKYRILANNGYVYHPTINRLLCPGEIVRLNVKQIGTVGVVFASAKHGDQYIGIKDLQLILPCSKFIHLDSIKNLPDNCFVRSQ